MTAWAVVAAHNPVLVVLRNQVPRSELEHMAKEVVDPIVVAQKAAAEAVHSMKVVADRVVAVADSDLAAVVDLDRKT